jgi:electron transfer flavoprotein alpha subunit
MILGLVEHDGGSLDGVSLEMLTLARDVAGQLDTAMEAIIIGGTAAPLAEELKAHGVTRLYHVQHERLNAYAPEAWAMSVVQLMERLQPQAVIGPGTDRGNEVMAFVAAHSDLPLAANCVAVRAAVQGGDPYDVTRVRWGGSLLEEAQLGGGPKLLTVAPHVVPAVTAPVAGDLSIEEMSPMLEERDFRVQVARKVEPEQDRIALADARVVVGGGRGLGSAEAFEVLEELAELLGGAVGGSRVATNLGWRPHADQIGQTGTRIAPDLYIACGISGAIQHMVGASGSKKIMAINKDREAPIVAKADYAVFGDLHEIVPALSAEIKRSRGG